MSRITVPQLNVVGHQHQSTRRASDNSKSKNCESSTPSEYIKYIHNSESIVLTPPIVIVLPLLDNIISEDI